MSGNKNIHNPFANTAPVEREGNFNSVPSKRLEASAQGKKFTEKNMMNEVSQIESKDSTIGFKHTKSSKLQLDAYFSEFKISKLKEGVEISKGDFCMHLLAVAKALNLQNYNFTTKTSLEIKDFDVEDFITFLKKNK